MGDKAQIRSTCATGLCRVKGMNAPYEPLLHALSQAYDIDPEETAEWRDALLALIGTQGPLRARQILDELAVVARQQRTGWQPELNTPYMNTIAVDEQPVFPGDLATEERLVACLLYTSPSPRDTERSRMPSSA